MKALLFIMTFLIVEEKAQDAHHSVTEMSSYESCEKAREELMYVMGTHRDGVTTYAYCLRE